MKRLITLFFALLLTGSIVDFSVAMPIEDGDIEEIGIETPNDTGRDREGSALVEAYLFHAANSIYITFASSVGSASILVKDAYETTVYLDLIDATQVGFTQFAAPTTPGTYTLEIQSLTYYGIGTFSV